MLMEYIDAESISDVGVGEDTFDEMCAVILGVSY
jgi:hypothetical protein